MRMTRLLLRAAAIVAAAMVLGGCSPPAFKSVDITGADYAHDFSLESASGGRRTLGDFRGKVVAVFFGYTQCPDVCPTTLADFAEVRRRLGADSDKLQVVFITLDPERDTPALLSQYVPAFDPTFVGLYGTADQTAATAKEFKVFYMKVAGKTPTSYTLDHTAGTFVFDKEGRIRLFVRNGASVDDIAADVRRLM